MQRQAQEGACKSPPLQILKSSRCPSGKTQIKLLDNAAKWSSVAFCKSYHYSAGVRKSLDPLQNHRFFSLKHRDIGRSRWELQHGSGGGTVHLSPAAVGSPRIKLSCSVAKARPCFGVWQSSLCVSARRFRNFHPHIMDHLICKPPAMWLEAETGRRAKSSLDVVQWSLSSHLGLQKLKICPSDYIE